MLDCRYDHEHGLLVSILRICLYRRRIRAKLETCVDQLTDDTVEGVPDVERLGHRVAQIDESNQCKEKMP